MKTYPTLDLHGFMTHEVPDAIDRFLSQQMKRGSDKVRIMTGKGTGAVRKATVDYLRLGGFPYSVEKLASGKPNEGVLVIHLED